MRGIRDAERELNSASERRLRRRFHSRLGNSVWPAIRLEQAGLVY